MVAARPGRRLPRPAAQKSWLRTCCQLPTASASWVDVPAAVVIAAMAALARLSLRGFIGCDRRVGDVGEVVKELGTQGLGKPWVLLEGPGQGTDGSRGVRVSTVGDGVDARADAEDRAGDGDVAVVHVTDRTDVAVDGDRVSPACPARSPPHTWT